MTSRHCVLSPLPHPCPAALEPGEYSPRPLPALLAQGQEVVTEEEDRHEIQRLRAEVGGAGGGCEGGGGGASKGEDGQPSVVHRRLG